MTTRSSVKYLDTVDHSTEAGAQKIQIIRDIVKSANTQARLVGDPERLEVVISPRKGKNNRHSWKYDNPQMRGKRFRLEDMERVDVYLVRRVK